MASRLLRKRIRLLSLCFSTISTVFLCTSVKILVQVPLHRGASYSLVSLVGEDVILPFQLNPPQDVTLLTVEWVKDQLVPKYVYVYHNSKYQYDVSNTGFKERTTLSQERLEHGDVSLKLFDVQLSDRGNYTCEVPKLGQFQDIELIIGAVSCPPMWGSGSSSGFSVLLKDTCFLEERGSNLQLLSASCGLRHSCPEEQALSTEVSGEGCGLLRLTGCPASVGTAGVDRRPRPFDLSAFVIYSVLGWTRWRLDGSGCAKLYSA